jgi:hypothetical protein
MSFRVHARDSARTPPSSFAPSHELLTVPEFAKRVNRKKATVYKWIRLGQMPPGSVLEVQKCLRIDWTIYTKSIYVRA